MRKSQWMGMGLIGVWSLLLGGCVQPQQSSVTRLRAGYDALAARQFDQAMAAADEVLAQNPAQTLPAEAHYLRGRVFEERAVENGGSGAAAQLQEARGEYTAALNLTHKPDLDGRLRAGVANVAFHQGDYATATEQWRAAFEELEKPEDRALTLYQLGRTAQRIGHWEDADKYLAGVVEASAGSELANKAKQIQGARGFTVQLATYADAKQADAAAADLRKQKVAAQHMVDPAKPALHLLRVGPLATYAEAVAIKGRFAAVYPGAVIFP